MLVMVSKLTSMNFGGGKDDAEPVQRRRPASFEDPVELFHLRGPFGVAETKLTIDNLHDHLTECQHLVLCGV